MIFWPPFGYYLLYKIWIIYRWFMSFFLFYLIVKEIQLLILMNRIKKYFNQIYIKHSGALRKNTNFLYQTIWVGKFIEHIGSIISRTGLWPGVKNFQTPQTFPEQKRWFPVKPRMPLTASINYYLLALKQIRLTVNSIIPCIHLSTLRTLILLKLMHWSTNNTHLRALEYM